MASRSHLRQQRPMGHRTSIVVMGHVRLHGLNVGPIISIVRAPERSQGLATLATASMAYRSILRPRSSSANGKPVDRFTPEAFAWPTAYDGRSRTESRA